jgi:hypothetical protein
MDQHNKRYPADVVLANASVPTLV